MSYEAARAHLERYGLADRIRTFESSTATVELAAEQLHCRPEHIAKTIALCGDELDIYSGNDDQVLPILALGGTGVISVFANICPAETHDICEKFFQGDLAGSRELFLKYLPLMEDLFMDVNPIPVKEAMNMMGMECGPCRLPLCEMSPAAKEKLAAALKRYGLI